jgi:hypothetical protein
MVARMLLSEHFRALDLSQRVQQSVGQARDEQLYWECASVLGVGWKVPARADVNFFGDCQTWETPPVLEESGDSVKSGDYGAKSPGSGSCDARALASSVGRAQRRTILSTARDEDFSWILNVWEDRVWLRDRVE